MLRRLKAEGHRVLLFTQMSKVLDVVETFLCFQGHTYMRLDGSTKIEMRQKLVERFNQDPKVFVFISSTRAGGVGINLTGADTVVFYDSDWNPAMDRQAQDRCHRIGQTREVHIYRLVSEHTVEENILRKANQKRHLEDLALKDSATSLFNPDFFKKVDVRDLFNDEPAAAAAVAAAPAAAAKRGPVTERDWEAATAAAEDENDAAAARLARAEEKEEAHEFDEDAEAAAAAAGGEGAAHAGSGSEGEDGGRGEAAALRIEDELTPVQRYALRFVEEQLRAAAAAAPQPPAGAASGAGAGGDKEGWEAEQLRRIQARDDDRLYDEDEVLLYETAGCRAQVLAAPFLLLGWQLCAI
jgi:superfamily II DNA/RNA helicase